LFAGETRQWLFNLVRSFVKAWRNYTSFELDSFEIQLPLVKLHFKRKKKRKRRKRKIS
jgi:hypothetical protein